MSSIDERMLELLNNTSVLEHLKNENVKLKEAAFKNYHYVLLKKWLIIIGAVFAGFFIGLAVSYFSPSAVSSNGQTLFESLTPTLIAPSITVNGLFITLTPVISFFFLSEIKDMEKESREDEEEIRKEIGDDKEALKELDNMVKYEHVFFHNLRSGILNYVRTYVSIALVSLFILLMTYVLNSVLFFVADILILGVLLTGVFPIISVALYKPVLTLVTIFLKDGKKEIITYGD